MASRSERETPHYRRPPRILLLVHKGPNPGGAVPQRSSTPAKGPPLSDALASYRLLDSGAQASGKNGSRRMMSHFLYEALWHLTYLKTKKGLLYCLSKHLGS